MSQAHAQYVQHLVENYGRLVFSAAHRILGNADDAEDVLQTVFLKLLQSPALCESTREWAAFLRVTATNLAIDTMRRRSRIVAYDPEQAAEVPDPKSETQPRDRLEQKQLAGLLRAALARLPRREARVFALRHFEELSYEEIMEQEGLNLGHVGVILHRARKKLRSMIEDALAPRGEKGAATHVKSKR